MASGNTSSQMDNIVGINIDGDPVTDISFTFEGRGFEGVNRREALAKNPLSRLTLLAMPSGNIRVALSLLNSSYNLYLLILL